MDSHFDSIRIYCLTYRMFLEDYALWNLEDQEGPNPEIDDALREDAFQMWQSSEVVRAHYIALAKSKLQAELEGVSEP